MIDFGDVIGGIFLLIVIAVMLLVGNMVLRGMDKEKEQLKGIDIGQVYVTRLVGKYTNKETKYHYTVTDIIGKRILFTVQVNTTFVAVGSATVDNFLKGKTLVIGNHLV